MGRETCVTFYTVGKAVIPVHFPNGMAHCQWCPYLRYHEGARRHQCALTNELLPYPFDGRGNECPVTFDAKEKEDGGNEFNR